MKPIRKILVPTDFSRPAAEAFAVAHELARSVGAGVVLLHVTRPPAVVSAEAAQAFSSPVDGEKDAWDKLRAIQPTDPAVRVEHEVIVTDRPDPSHVLKIVETAGCDLIVMGTHGLSGLKHRLFGGLTEEVVRLARCPVMVVKAPSAPEATRVPKAGARAAGPVPPPTKESAGRSIAPATGAHDGVAGRRP